MYTDEGLWEGSIKKGRKILKKKMTIDAQEKGFMAIFEGLVSGSSYYNKSNDFRRGILWAESLRSTEMQSLYINEKQKLSNT